MTASFLQEYTASVAPALLKPVPIQFDYGLPEPMTFTVIINPSSVRKADEARFDRAHTALAPKRSIRRTRRRRHLFVGSDRPGYRIPNVRFSAPTLQVVGEPVEGFEIVDLSCEVIHSTTEICL